MELKNIEFLQAVSEAKHALPTLGMLGIIVGTKPDQIIRSGPQQKALNAIASTLAATFEQIGELLPTVMGVATPESPIYAAQPIDALWNGRAVTLDRLAGLSEDETPILGVRGSEVLIPADELQLSAPLERFFEPDTYAVYSKPPRQPHDEEGTSDCGCAPGTCEAAGSSTPASGTPNDPIKSILAGLGLGNPNVEHFSAEELRAQGAPADIIAAAEASGGKVAVVKMNLSDLPTGLASALLNKLQPPSAERLDRLNRGEERLRSADDE